MMGHESGFDEKIDVIDLIINVLKDHEKKLDELVSRIEKTQIIERAPTDTIEEITPQIERVSSLPAEKTSSGIPVKMELSEWNEFRTKCESARLVAFEVADGRFQVTVLTDSVLYKYTEKIPSMEIRYKTVDEKAQIESIDINRAELVSEAFNGILKCGLKMEKTEHSFKEPGGESILKVNFHVDTATARSWIAYQLSVDDEKILHGSMNL
jgi:hypothetical protein